HAVPVRFAIVHSRLDHTFDPSVIERAVETAIGLDSFPHHCLDFGCARYIGSHEGCLSTSSFNQPYSLFAAFRHDVSYHNSCSFTSKDLRRGATDARASTGNQRNLASNTS